MSLKQSYKIWMFLVALCAIMSGCDYMGLVEDRLPTVVVLGHTHQSELSIQRARDESRGFIYANTGAWVDEEASSYPVGTFVEIYDGVAGYKRVSLQQWTPSGSTVSQNAALWQKNKS